MHRLPRPPWSLLGTTLLLAVWTQGCQHRAAQFDTVTQAEQAEPSTPVEPRSAVPVRPVGSRMDLEEGTQSFLLALENRAGAQLRRTMTEDAVIHQEGSAAQLPAHSTLQGFGAAPEAKGTQLGTSSSSMPWFGPAKIVEIRADKHVGQVTIDVSGPKKLRGSWTLIFAPEFRPPRIREIIIPKSR